MTRNQVNTCNMAFSDQCVNSIFHGCNSMLTSKKIHSRCYVGCGVCVSAVGQTKLNRFFVFVLVLNL